MDLVEALRSTGAVREFEPDPVDHSVVYRILETARFAPNGGNRQAWKVVVVRDGEVRRGIRDLYLPGWYEYLAMTMAGLTPWAPVTDREAEAKALQGAGAVTEQAAAGPGGFAEHLDQVPVLMVVLADLRRLAATDRDLDRYTMVGGASMYPFAWSILLAARSEGLGGVITTMVTRHERDVRTLLHAPDNYAVACVLALGRPRRQLRKLTRLGVEEFTTTDHVDGPVFNGA